LCETLGTGIMFPGRSALSVVQITQRFGGWLSTYSCK